VSEIAPGWYKDPAEPTTQRYWDGEGWLGDPLPADATPPSGPPAVKQQPRSELGAADDPAARPAGTGGGAGRPVSGMPTTAAPSRPGAPVLPSPPPSPTTRPVPPGWPTGYPYPYAGTLPAPRPHGLTLARPSARLAARLVDITIVLLLCAVANAWFAIQWWRSVEPFAAEYWRRATEQNMGNPNTLPAISPQANTLLLMIFLVITAVWFAYEVPGSANTGQTLGKRLLGIKVMRIESDERLGFGRAWRRWSRLGLPTMLWYCCGIGFVLQIIDCLFVLVDRPMRQAMHDKAAGTVVVRVGRSTPNQASPSETPAGGSHDRSDAR